MGYLYDKQRLHQSGILRTSRPQDQDRIGAALGLHGQRPIRLDSIPPHSVNLDPVLRQKKKD